MPGKEELMWFNRPKLRSFLVMFQPTIKEQVAMNINVITIATKQMRATLQQEGKAIETAMG